MKPFFLTLLGLLPLTPTFADTYTLYIIEASDPALPEESDLDLLTILETPGIQITHAIQTEGIPHSPEPDTSSTSSDPFQDSSNRVQSSGDVVGDSAGTRFQVLEDGDHITCTFSEILEVESSSNPPTGNAPSPLLEKTSIASDLTLMPERFSLVGKHHRQTMVDGQQPFHRFRWFIVLRGSPENAKIQSTTSPNDIFFSDDQQGPLPLEPAPASIQIVVNPDKILWMDQSISLDSLPQRLESHPKDQSILLKVAPSIKFERMRTVMEVLQADGFKNISVQTSTAQTGSAMETAE
ncbi:MAG: ExbD/TolR family protein [Puniceicoccales bacterium]